MIVVADNSILLNLCRIAQADLLPRLFVTVLAPPVVRTEFEAAVARYLRFRVWLSRAPSPCVRLVNLSKPSRPTRHLGPRRE